MFIGFYLMCMTTISREQSGPKEMSSFYVHFIFHQFGILYGRFFEILDSFIMWKEKLPEIQVKTAKYVMN